MRWLILVAVAGSTLASKLTPPVLPLIVRNPYLSTWLGDARQPPWHEWPMFWTGERVSSQRLLDRPDSHMLRGLMDYITNRMLLQIGFSIMVTMPGSDNVYPLLGRPQDSLSLDTHAEYVLPLLRPHVSC